MVKKMNKENNFYKYAIKYGIMCSRRAIRQMKRYNVNSSVLLAVEPEERGLMAKLTNVSFERNELIFIDKKGKEVIVDIGDWFDESYKAYYTRFLFVYRVNGVYYRGVEQKYTKPDYFISFRNFKKQYYGFILMEDELNL